MKQNIFFLLSLCIVLFSCSGDSDDPIKGIEKSPVETEDPFITLKKSNIDFTNEGGEEAIVIESNVTWTAKSSASWCTVSPTSGNKSTGSIKITADENETYDDRKCTVTIEGNGVTKTIAIIQSKENAIILSKKTFDISSNSQTLEIELKTNVDFELIIANEAKDWISYIGTRALRTEILLLEVSSNENDKARSTEIFIKNKNTSLQDTLTINQKGNEPGVYYVDKMGTLGSMLNYAQKDTITTMIVKGEINKADFEVMKKQMPKLRYLDLKEVKCEGDKIPDRAFGRGWTVEENKYINTIILPESITAIGEEAFHACIGLMGNLIIPDGVTTIGEWAFAYCRGFTGNLILPDELTTIGGYAFYSCSGFTGDLIIPSNVTTIGDGAFSYCSRLTGNLIISEGIKTIEANAFKGYTNFKGKLILPEGLEVIKMRAFYGCSGFTDLTLGKNIVAIYEEAFYGCSNITGDVVFPQSLTSIRISGFEGCYNVDAFQFPHTTPLRYNRNMLEKSVPVKVPNKAVSAYKSANGWKEHTIVGY